MGTRSLPDSPPRPLLRGGGVSPQAQGRQIVLGGHPIAYELRRSKRRTIGLAIDHRGLRVGAPQRATLGQIEALIRQHQDWVLSKLEEWRSRPSLPLLAVGDGMCLPLLGEPIRVGISAGPSRRSFGDGHLQLSIPESKDPRPFLERALKEHARSLFVERLAHYAPRLGVEVPPLALSSARTRWGSCSRLSGIRLNWRLIHFPLAVIDYLVVHELAHLKEMNHSPRFWSVVEQIYPHHRQARADLKRLAAALPRW